MENNWMYTVEGDALKDGLRYWRVLCHLPHHPESEKEIGNIAELAGGEWVSALFTPEPYTRVLRASDVRAVTSWIMDAHKAYESLLVARGHYADVLGGELP